MKRKVVITIANWAGVNTGDDIIFETLGNLILRLANELQLENIGLFVLADNDISIIKKYKNKYNIIDAVRIFEFYKWTNILKTIDFLIKSDLLIYGGGDLINGNIPSMTLLGLAKIFGLPVILVGVGVVYPTSNITRFITKLILNHVDAICVRDEKSRQCLIKLGITKPKIYNASDLVFTLSPFVSLSNINKLIQQLKNNNKLLIGVNVRPYDPMYSKYSTWCTEEIIHTFADLCDTLIEKYDAKIIFIPMVIKDKTYPYHPNLLSDDELSKKIIEFMQHKDKAYIVTDYQTLDDLFTLLSNIDVLISMRLHPILLASLVGTPSISISYSPKVEIFMKELNMHYYIVPIDKLENKKILSLIDTLINNNSFNKLIKPSLQSLKIKAKLNEKIIYEFLYNSLKNNYKKSHTRIVAGVIAAFFIMSFNYSIHYIQKIINIVKRRKRNKK